MANIRQIQESHRLPSIIHRDGKQAVGARDLYQNLGLNNSQFTRWAKKNICNNSFAEQGNDWLDIMSNGKQDFVLSLDFAKRLAMMARTERGEQIRNYFIECEHQAQTKPRTQIEILLESVQLLHDHESKLSSIDGRVADLEAKSTTSLGYYSIAGYAALKKKSIDIKMASSLGAKAKAACRVIGCILGTIPDPRFGKVNTYPQEVLESVFDEFFRGK
jgi:anti-repressor protein